MSLLLKLLCGLGLVEFSDLDLCEVAQLLKFSDLLASFLNCVQSLLHLEAADLRWRHAVTEGDGSVADSVHHLVNLLVCLCFLLLFKLELVLLLAAVIVILLRDRHLDFLHFRTEVLLKHEIDFALEK